VSGTVEIIQSAFLIFDWRKYFPMFSALSEIIFTRGSRMFLASCLAKFESISKQNKTHSGCIFLTIFLVILPIPAPNSTKQRAFPKSMELIISLATKFEVWFKAPTWRGFLKKALKNRFLFFILGYPQKGGFTYNFLL